MMDCKTCIHYNWLVNESMSNEPKCLLGEDGCYYSNKYEKEIDEWQTLTIAHSQDA